MEELIKRAKKVLLLVQIFMIAILLFLLLYVIKMTGLIAFIKTLLMILAPLFIGIIIAWLLEPIIEKLIKRKISRIPAALIVYSILLLIITLFTWIFIKEIYIEVNNFITILPDILDELSSWLDKIFADIPQYNSIKVDIFNAINNVKNSMVKNLPTKTIEVVKVIISNISTFGIGFIIALYFTITNKKNNIISKLSKEFQKDATHLSTQINESLRSFVIGTLGTSGGLGIVSAIAFYFIGLRSPALFGFICGVTDLIPYVGGYIGGGVSVIVGFSISTQVGILTLVAIIVIQIIQSFILKPIIMSKSMEMHPITIIVGLMVFGHYFGMMGMFLATPIMATTKIVFSFIDKKFNIWDRIVEVGNWLVKSD